MAKNRSNKRGHVESGQHDSISLTTDFWAEGRGPCAVKGVDGKDFEPLLLFFEVKG